jgi:stringent starvation protein B
VPFGDPLLGCQTVPDAQLLPPKHDVARALLVRGSVFVHLDPRQPAVRVPDHLRKQPQLVLQVGLDMPISIPDLRVTSDGVYATLSFSRTPFPCWIPWSAVFALLDERGKGMLWPEDLPVEIAAEVSSEMERAIPKASARDEDAPARPRARARRRETAGPAPQPAAMPEAEPARPLAARSRQRNAALQAAPPAAPPPPPVVGLRAVPGGGSGQPAGKPRTGERPSYLRIVK